MTSFLLPVAWLISHFSFQNALEIADLSNLKMSLKEFSTVVDVAKRVFKSGWG